MDPSSQNTSAPTCSSGAVVFLHLDFSAECHKERGALERICGATDIGGHGSGRRLPVPHHDLLPLPFPRLGNGRKAEPIHTQPDKLFPMFPRSWFNQGFEAGKGSAFTPGRTGSTLIQTSPSKREKKRSPFTPERTNNFRPFSASGATKSPKRTKESVFTPDRTESTSTRRAPWASSAPLVPLRPGRHTGRGGAPSDSPATPPG
jgi:hypothetical protein